MSARRKFSGPPNHYKGPQYRRIVSRLNFERNAKDEFPSLRGIKVQNGYQYKVRVQVPHYDERVIRIRFSGVSDTPSVLADGPKESPHRYSDGSLCMWYPDDPIERRWVFSDGLVSLIGLTIVHLFQEAWWRETGEWAGQEVPHGPIQKKESSVTDR